MSKNRLTLRQENFVLNLFKGMGQADAYKEAGYSVRGKRSSIDTLASILASKPAIQARYNELLKEVQTDAVASVLERREKLTEVMRSEIKEPVTAREVVTAIAEQNKMEHIYEPETRILQDIKVLVIREGDKGKDQNPPLLPEGGSGVEGQEEDS